MFNRGDIVEYDNEQYYVEDIDERRRTLYIKPYGGSVMRKGALVSQDEVVLLKGINDTHWQQ